MLSTNYVLRHLTVAFHLKDGAVTVYQLMGYFKSKPLPAQQLSLWIICLSYWYEQHFYSDWYEQHFYSDWYEQHSKNDLGTFENLRDRTKFFLRYM